MFKAAARCGFLKSACLAFLLFLNLLAVSQYDAFSDHPGTIGVPVSCNVSAINGSIATGEWSSTPLRIEQGGSLVGWAYVQHDGTQLCFLLDLIGDTADNDGDGFSLWIDANTDGFITPRVDAVYFLQSARDPFAQGRDQFTRSIFAAAGETERQDAPTAGRAVAGFGPSPNSTFSHRFYEIAIPLSEINVAPGTLVGIAIFPFSWGTVQRDSLSNLLYQGRFPAGAETVGDRFTNFAVLHLGSGAASPSGSVFTWQWPDLSVASGKVCVAGVCIPTGGSVNQAQAFPAEVADGMSRLGVQSARLTEGNLPSGLNFNLGIPSRLATLNGTVSSSLGLRLVYDLLNGSGGKVASLAVLINVQLSGDSTPTPTPSGCNPSCKVNLVALIQGSGGTFTSVSGVPIKANGSSRSTPFSVSGPAGAAITLQASSTIKAGGKTYAFKEWRSDVTGFLTNKNPLKGKMDRNETIQAIYVLGSGGETIKFTIKAKNGNTFSALKVSIATSFGPVTTPATLALNSGGGITLTAPKNFGGTSLLDPLLTFSHWEYCVGFSCLGISDRILTLDSNTMDTEAVAVYKE